MRRRERGNVQPSRLRAAARSPSAHRDRRRPRRPLAPALASTLSPVSPAIRNAAWHRSPHCWSPTGGRHGPRRSIGRSPGPDPGRVALVVTNGSKMRSRSADGMPAPRSATETSTLPVRGRSRSHQQPAVRFPAVHGIASVDHEVEQYLLQLVPIAAHGWQRVGKVGADHHLPVQQVAAHQAQRLLDHVVDVERMTLRLFLPEQDRSRWITAPAR